MFHGQWNGVDVYLRLLSKWNDVMTVNYTLICCCYPHLMAECSRLEGRGGGHALQIEGAFAAPVLLGAGCQRL